MGSSAQLSLRAWKLGAMCAARSVRCWLLSATICESLRLSSGALESWWEPMHAAGSVEQLYSWAPPYAALWRSSVTHRHPSQTLIRSSSHHSLCELSRTLHSAFNTFHFIDFVSSHTPPPLPFFKQWMPDCSSRLARKFFFNDPVVIFSIILLSYSSMLRGSISHRALVEKDVSQAVSPTFRSVSLLLFGVSFVSSSLASTALPLGNRCLSKKRVSVSDFGALARSQLTAPRLPVQLQG